jgi:hypothetical protein
MLVDKAVRNDLSLNTRVIRSVVPANDLINDIDKGREKKLPEYGSFPVILSPYSNEENRFSSGKRIGARISMYEERERER